MKRFLSIFLAVAAIFSLAACSKNNGSEYGDDDVGKALSKFNEENSSTKKDPTVLEGLSDEQKEFAEGLGFCEDDKKIVAYYDTTNYAIYYVFDFKDGKTTKATYYNLVKSYAMFEGLVKAVNGKSEASFSKEERCMIDDKTEKFADKTYAEIIELLKDYTLVNEKD